MNISYEDFLNKATAAGLLGEFSDYDLAIAKKHPEFGLSILTLKQNIHAAETKEAKALAHAQAEELRQRYGSYSGGEKGADYIALAPSGESTLFDMSKTEPFRYSGDAQLQKALGEVASPAAFSYDAASDPLYQSYRKQYLREGERAAENALAKSAAATLGVPGSYAVTAASQAQDYYASKLSDKLPELYQAAYERYGEDFTRKLKALTALESDRAAEQSAYDSAFKQLAELYDAAQKNDAAREKAAAEERETAAKQVEALLKIGKTPPKALLEKSGLSAEYVELMLALFSDN